jgi:membrane associated rhomboid family serine protease
VAACLDHDIVFSMPPLTPTVKKLIVGLFAAFVLELILLNFVQLDVFSALALKPKPLSIWTPLQLFTHVLVDDPRFVMSMLINLIFMWLILSPFEVTFGSRHVLELAVCGTLAGGVAAIAVAYLAPVDPNMLFGSRSIAYAGMAAMTQVIGRGRIMFFGVVPMSSRTLLLVLAGMSFLFFLADKNYISLVGSLAAMAAGIGYVRYMARAPKPPRRKGSSPPRFRVLRGGGGSGEGDSERPKWLN